MRMRRCFAAGLLAAAALVPAGCGAKPASASGTVTLDGQPVTGHIVFVPEDETQPKRGGPIEAGRYDVAAARGPTPGLHRVQIYSRKKTGRIVPGPDPEQTVEETREIVPAKYNRDTTLTAAVAPGANTLDFNLSSK